MRTITSSSGQTAAVVVRRSESADAEGINTLISPEALQLFGKVNVIHVLELANLAVTVAREDGGVLAHAAFQDHPAGTSLDLDHWDRILKNHLTAAETCSPFNTLFLQLFVSELSFAAESLKEIMRAVFSAVVELEHVCLIGPDVTGSELSLDQVFQPQQQLTEISCYASICHRKDHCPRLQLRPARVEDHDDIMKIFAEQTKLLSSIQQPYFLTRLIEDQDQNNRAAVCESRGVAVGFISLSADVDVKLLVDCFQLRDSEDFYKKQEEAAGEEEMLRVKQQEENQPPASGEPHIKAFCIQLFIIDKDHEMRSVDFIPYAFQLFPDLDFCIITVPSLSSDFPLLQNFFRVPPRPGSSPNSDLYMFHRAGLREVQVRPAVPADRPAVSDLVQDLGLNESLLQDLDRFYQTLRDTDGLLLQAFVAQVDSRVVGVLVLRDEQDVEFLRARYNLENFIYFSQHRYQQHGQIRHFTLRPWYQHHARYLVREGLRLAHRSCLYLRGYTTTRTRTRTRTSQEEGSCVHPLDLVLDCSVPVRPRQQIVYPLDQLGTNGPSRRILQDQAPFSLNLVSRKLTLELKVQVKVRMVVVGASDTAVAFLETLCFCPHLRFNSITLISTHGFPGNHSDDDATFLSTSHAYSSRDLAQIPLLSNIMVVTGKMVNIDRKNKHVLVSDGRKVPYDLLILCTGLQYQVPCPSVVDPSQNQVQASPGPLRTTVPQNLLVLNDLQDCHAARCWLEDNFLHLEDDAVVYGDTIDVYTTVQTLLRLGVSGPRIHLVLPPQGPRSRCFGDPAVEGAVMAALDQARVQVHRDCLLDRMTGDPISAVWFSTNQEPLHLACGVFFSLFNKSVDPEAFSSITDSFLVFDGRLVIDASFRTIDPAVYGAGPLTKFSRRYHADEWTHASFDSKEVGRDLAAMLLPLFDPTLEPANEPPQTTDLLIKLYKQPKVQGGKLPGGFNYLHVAKPTAAHLTGAAVRQLQDGVLVTGRVETGNYFSLHLSRYDTVETLTCLSLEPLPLHNYLSLYGKQQQLLGQLSTRYQQGQIQDLYRFFSQSSCLAVYLDRFSDFEQELCDIITSPLKDEEDEDDDGDEGDGDDGDEGGDDDGDDHKKPSGLPAQVAAAVRLSASRYLSYNSNLLPMFACPGQKL